MITNVSPILSFRANKVKEPANKQTKDSGVVLKKEYDVFEPSTSRRDGRAKLTGLFAMLLGATTLNMPAQVNAAAPVEAGKSHRPTSDNFDPSLDDKIFGIEDDSRDGTVYAQEEEISDGYKTPVDIVFPSPETLDFTTYDASGREFSASSGTTTLTAEEAGIEDTNSVKVAPPGVKNGTHTERKFPVYEPDDAVNKPVLILKEGETLEDAAKRAKLESKVTVINGLVADYNKIDLESDSPSVIAAKERAARKIAQDTLKKITEIELPKARREHATLRETVMTISDKEYKKWANGLWNADLEQQQRINQLEIMQSALQDLLDDITEN